MNSVITNMRRLKTFKPHLDKKLRRFETFIRERYFLSTTLENMTHLLYTLKII